MDLGKNPLLKSTHDFKLETIYKRFPILGHQGQTEVLSLFDYFDSRPQKFYSKEVFKIYYEFISELAVENPDRLKTLINEQSTSLDIAFKSLSRINGETIHDIFPPKDEISRIHFLDKYIHYNYQRLIEGVYHAFIYPIAFHLLKSRNKETNNMNIYNCNQVLENSKEFKLITEYYDHLIRNAIAHHDIEYLETEINYSCQNKTKSLHSLEVIKLFDKMLDICNGMAFAFKTFILANDEFIKENEILIPKWIIVEELIPNLNTHEWQIEDLFESTLPDGRKQLNIHGNNRLLHFQEALFYSFQTALLAERFISGYDRYYLNSNSKYAWLCFGGFNGIILRENREKNTRNYLGVVDDVLFFNPNYKIPRLFRKLRRMFFTIKNEYKYKFSLSRKKPYNVRWTKSHRNKYHSVVSGSIVLTNINELPENIIRENIAQIVRNAVKNSRKNTSRLKRHRYLRVGYLRIFIYAEDRRLREIKDSGLTENLVCTIQVKKLKRIESPDIIGSKIETIGKYRIAWNSKSSVFERIHK